MPEEAHGKASGYTFWGCRRKWCKKAARISNATRTRASRVDPGPSLLPPTEHGARRGYDYWGCDCIECLAVESAFRAGVKAAKRSAHEGPVTVRRFEYRIHPEPSAEIALRRIFGACRYVYNSYIALARGRHESGEKHSSAYDASKILVTRARRAEETSWLADVPHAVLAASVHDAADAYSRFFDSIAGRRKGPKVGRPRFKSRKTARRAARFRPRRNPHVGYVPPESTSA